MRFSYYSRLSRRDQAIYRKSDAVTALPLDDAAALRAHVDAIARALRDEERGAVQRACNRFARELCAQLGAPPLTVRVLSVRPSDEQSELHGYYEAEDGRRPVVRVWMKTAAQKRTVAFRTFLRTLLHELVHHHDFFVAGYAESFHTEGFFRRESHLMRQLAPAPPRAPARRRPTQQRFAFGTPDEARN